MVRWFLLIIGCLVWTASSSAFAADEKPAAEKPAEAHPEAAHHDAAHGDAAGHGAAAHGDAHHAAGTPQLPAEPNADLALWSAVTFLVFLFVLSKLAWKPLINGMNAREEKIRKDIADAEANRGKSEALFREYEAKLAKAQEEVKGILTEARKDAESAKADIIATAEKESTSMRQRAVADIDRARDQAIGDLFGFVSKNVMQATEQIVGRSLTGPDQDRLVQEALANLDLRKN